MFLTVPLCGLASNQWIVAVFSKLKNGQTDREITKTHMFYFTQNMHNMLRQKQIISPKTAAPKIQTPSETKNIDLKKPAADRTLRFMSFFEVVCFKFRVITTCCKNWGCRNYLVELVLNGLRSRLSFDCDAEHSGTMVGWESLGAWAKTLSYRFVIHHLVHKD
jgi:hypothetical protein